MNKEDLILEAIYGIRADIGEMKQDISSLKADVSTLKADVVELKADVSMLKADVSGLTEDVSMLKSDVSKLKSLKELVADLHDKYEKLNAFVTIMHTDMVDGFAALHDGRALNYERHGRLEKRVCKLEKDNDIIRGNLNLVFDM